MRKANDSALKEWTVVIEALGQGRQVLLLRKGGILEQKDGFTVEHREFFLFPTSVHQKAADLIPEAHADLAVVAGSRPADGLVHFAYYAVVEDAVRVTELERLPSLQPYHILSWSAVEQRFHYRRPGLSALTLKVYRLPRIVAIPHRSRYGGCLSWVDLDRALPTAGAEPVLPEAAFTKRAEAIRAHLAL